MKDEGGREDGRSEVGRKEEGGKVRRGGGREEGKRREDWMERAGPNLDIFCIVYLKIRERDNKINALNIHTKPVHL